MNLAQLLNLDRPLIVLDLETTGVVDGSRIIEIGHRVWTPGATEAKEWRTLVNPEIPIPQETTLVHKISDGDVRACRTCDEAPDKHPTVDCQEFKPWPTFFQLAQNLAKGYSGCDFAGKNIRFDLGILAGEFQRVSVEWTFTGARILDAERLEATLEPRDLSSLYRRRIGREPVDAHSALADVRMTEEILVDQLTKGAAILPPSLTKLHEISWPGWIDTKGKFRRGKDGVVRIQFGEHRGADVRKVRVSYWQWICRSNFSDEMKMLARGMAEGRFP